MSLLRIIRAVEAALTYDKLPPNPPYGFWILPDLKIVKVARDHGASAAKILKLPVGGKGESFAASKAAWQLGWVDVVTVGSSLYFRSARRPVPVSKGQKRLIRDIAVYYGLEIREDSD